MSSIQFVFYNWYRFVLHSYDDVTAIKNILDHSWDGVLFTNDMTVNYFNKGKKAEERLGSTLDVVRSHSPVFFFPKHSILTWLFEMKVEACKESGLTYYWAMKYSQKLIRSKSKYPKKLAINNILAMLQILCIMYSIAVFAFVLELLSRKHKRIRTFLDYVTYWMCRVVITIQLLHCTLHLCTNTFWNKAIFSDELKWYCFHSVMIYYMHKIALN